MTIDGREVGVIRECTANGGIRVTFFLASAPGRRASFVEITKRRRLRGHWRHAEVFDVSCPAGEYELFSDLARAECRALDHAYPPGTQREYVG